MSIQEKFDKIATPHAVFISVKPQRCMFGKPGLIVTYRMPEFDKESAVGVNGTDAEAIASLAEGALDKVRYLRRKATQAA